MLNKKSFLSLATILVLLALPAIAIAQKIDVKTGNTRTIIDDDGEVYVETNPSTTTSANPTLKPRGNSTHSNRSSSSSQSNSNCHTESHTYKNNEGGNSVYSHSSTTICK